MSAQVTHSRTLLEEARALAPGLDWQQEGPHYVLARVGDVTLHLSVDAFGLTSALVCQGAHVAQDEHSSFAALAAIRTSLAPLAAIHAALPEIP